MPLLLPCLVVWSALGAEAEPRFRLEPPPAWVDLRPLDPPAPGDPGAPLQRLLIESQVRATSTSFERFSRTATRVLAPTGMGEVSQLELSFDPTYQQLTIHGVWIHRNGQQLDALIPGDIKVIQQEKELEARLYNGTLTAVLFLKDVRVGDTIEVTHTVTGQNLFLTGKVADAFVLGSSTSVARIYRRLLAPEALPLFLKAHGTSAAPVTTVKDGVRDYRWELRDAAPVAYEDGLPPWVDPWPWVQVSSFATWSDVAGWAVGLFTPGPDGPAEAAAVEAQLAQWMKLPTPQERLLAATRFVQDEVRYLGIELGENSHQPHAPTQVFNQRFGDCKDKSLLLVTLLRRMGISADPALVSVDHRRGLADHHPWPFAFDHAIVRAELDGKPIWIDGTASLERGRLAARAPPPFERALLVRADATGLIEIPAEDLDTPTTDLEEKYELESTGLAALHVTSRYKGSDAYQMRHAIAAQSREKLQKHYLNRYAREDPAIVVSAPLEIVDDLEANQIEVRQHYQLKAFWRGASHQLSATSLESELRNPYTSLRTLPLWVEPKHLRHVIEVHWPGQDELNPVDKTITGPAATLSFNLTSVGSVLRLEFNYRTIKEQVEASAIKPYLDSLDEMRQLAISLPAPASLGPGATPDERLRGLIISAVVFAALIGFFFVYPAFQRRKARRYQR